MACVFVSVCSSGGYSAGATHGKGLHLLDDVVGVSRHGDDTTAGDGLGLHEGRSADRLAGEGGLQDYKRKKEGKMGTKELVSFLVRRVGGVKKFFFRCTPAASLRGGRDGTARETNDTEHRPRAHTR